VCTTEAVFGKPNKAYYEKITTQVLSLSKVSNHPEQAVSHHTISSSNIHMSFTQFFYSIWRYHNRPMGGYEEQVD